MPLASSHQLYFPRPLPQTPEEIAEDLQNLQRWGQQLPFHAPQKWSCYLGSIGDSAFVAAGANGPLTPGAGWWYDVNTQLKFPFLDQMESLKLPFLKHDFDTYIEVTFSCSCYIDSGVGVVTFAMEFYSLDAALASISSPISPLDNAYVPPRTFGKFFFNNALVHHAIPTYTLIVPPCPNGWWVIKPVVYTVPKVIFDTNDVITITAREIPKPHPYYTGSIP